MGLIWQRYVLFRFLKMFIFFLFGFYGLYILIDYANLSHAALHRISIAELVGYYLSIFLSRAEILIPLALLVAFVNTLCTLNRHCELIALMVSGISLKVILRPFLLVGALFFFLMYVNEQFWLPSAYKRIKKVEYQTKHQKKRNYGGLEAHSLILSDGSLLIFQDYDAEKKEFFDVYWIQSIDQLYRMKYLSHSLIPTGQFVESFFRYPTGELKEHASYQTYSFPEMSFESDMSQIKALESDFLSLSELAKEAHFSPNHLNEKESKILTSYYWKLLIPFLCLLAIIAPAPYCTQFSRQLPLFLIYFCTLFGLISFYLFLDAAQVLSKRQVLSPFWALLFPFILTFFYFGWQYIRNDSNSTALVFRRRRCGGI